mmetsp:Transcript_14170/g.29009  ORF Transcript_14170/g.29009 Transcript_14170/m.29009 type:complete len:127 (-) Transcript_14170:1137-1517(-)
MSKTLEFQCADEGSVTALGYDPISKHLFAGSAQGAIRQLSLESGGIPVQSLLGHTRPVVACQYDQSKLVSGAKDGSVRVWDPMTGECLYAIAGFTNWLTSVQFDRDKLVFDGTNDVIIAAYYVAEQ